MERTEEQKVTLEAFRNGPTHAVIKDASELDDKVRYAVAKTQMNSIYGSCVDKEVNMDNLSRTQEILKGKGLTAAQALMHITALENDIAFMDHELGQLRDNFDELEYSDPDSCSQYNEEDVHTLLNIYQNRMQRFLRLTSDVITAMKAQCAEVSDDT